MLRHGSFKGKRYRGFIDFVDKAKEGPAADIDYEEFLHTVGFMGKRLKTTHLCVCVCVCVFCGTVEKMFAFKGFFRKKKGLGNENGPMFLGEKHFRGRCFFVLKSYE